MLKNKFKGVLKILLMLVAIIRISSDFAYARAIYKKSINEESVDIYAKNNEILNVVLSEKEINRISFEGEKVKGLHYTDGEMEFSIEDGDLYIKIKAEKPVNFFIKMESGRTYQMLVVTSDTPSIQYFVKRGEGKARVALDIGVIKRSVRRELNSYEGEINKIMSVAETVKKYMGYELKKLNKKISLKVRDKGVGDRKDGRKIKTIEGKEVLLVKGKGFGCHKVEISNNSNEEVEIKAEYFEGNYEDVVASYIEKERLGVKEKTNLYIVSKL